MNNSNDNFTFKDFLLLILFLVLIAVPIYLAYKILLPESRLAQDKEEMTAEEQPTVEEPTEEEIPQGPHYEELFVTVSDQVAYIAVPTNIKEDNPPTIVIYNHGSNTTVTSDTTDQFIKDLQQYGELYTKSNLIFAASNQHGANWGNAASIQDNKNLIEWIKENYKAKEKVYVLGFSMGGLPALNFATTYPELVEKVALLAPTTRSNEWNQTRIDKLKDVEIQIWHGDADVNVGYYLSSTFVNRLKTLGREVPLITLDGKTHWDVDTEYMQAVLDFFLQTESTN